MCARSQIETLHNDSKKRFTRNGKPIDSIELNEGCVTLLTSPREGNTVSAKKTYPYLGRQVAGEPVDFEPTSEPWSQYKLADGTEMKAKMVLLNVARLDEFNEQGEPVYQFQFQQVVAAVSPDSLKRKTQ